MLINLWNALNRDDSENATALIYQLGVLLEEWEKGFVLPSSVPIYYPAVTPPPLSQASYDSSVDPVCVTSGQTAMGDATSNHRDFMNVSHCQLKSRFFHKT